MERAVVMVFSGAKCWLYPANTITTVLSLNALTCYLKSWSSCRRSLGLCFSRKSITYHLVAAKYLCYFSPWQDLVTSLRQTYCVCLLLKNKCSQIFNSLRASCCLSGRECHYQGLGLIDLADHLGVDRVGELY
jgi:hypothetical protein